MEIMARVLVYERAVDTLLTDATFYNKLNHAKNGIKIKQEPLDPDIDKLGDSSSFNDTSSVITQSQCKLVTAEDQISCNLYKEKNECVSPKGHATSENNKSDIRRKKCKKVGTSKVLTRKRSHLHKKSNTLEYKRRKKSQKRVKCDVCYVSFVSESTMKSHKISSDLLNKSVKYRCDICNGIYTSNYTLHRHRQSCASSPGQPINRRLKYVCHFCDRKFTSKKLVQAHLFHLHGSLIVPTTIDIDKAEQTATIQNTDDCETNIHVPEESKESPSNASMKKMRQTTLNEFLPLFSKYFAKEQKKVCANPDEIMLTANIGDTRGHGKSVNSIPCNGLRRTVKDNEKFILAASPGNQSITKTVAVYNKRPFVQIHVNPDMMMTLLNTKIKTEPEESYTQTTSYNASYNLRRLRRNSRRSSFEQDGAPSKSPGRSGRKTIRYQDMQLWEEQMRTKFNCRECIIRLEKCDWSSNNGNSKGNESQGFGENVENNSREGNLVLKNLEVPLVRMNSLAEVAIDKEESQMCKDNNKATEGKVVRCKVCEKSFSSKENMREHVELFHVAYMSSICNARYTSMHKLLDHYLRQHAVFKRKTCCVCHEKLSAPTMLKRHMVLHCIKIIRSKKDKTPIDSEVKCNMFKKHHRCKACGKRFWLNSCLNQHQRVCRRMNVKVDDSVLFEENQTANTTEMNRRKIRHRSELSVQCPSKEYSSKNKKIPAVEDKMKSVPNIMVNSNERAGGTLACETNSSQLRKTANHKRLITGIACVKGYQVDATTSDRIIKFPCSICAKQFQTFQNLCIHERTFCRPADNPCSICSTAFSTKRLLQLHMLATHTPSCSENYKYFCKFCNQGFVKKTNVQIHERHFHANQMTVSSESSLVSSHIWNMNTVCTVCNLMFESYERFIEHNMYYYKGQVFTCTFCGKSFQGMYMLHHHNKLVHYPEGTRNAYTYTCDTCNEGFNQESHFHAHKLHVHLHDIPSVENSAKSVQDHPNQDHNYALMTNNGISVDASMKVPIMTYTCDICSLNFTNERDLSMHEMEYSVDGDVQCDKCDRKCRTVAILIKHQSLNHSGYDISSCYKCRFCGEVLTTNTAMTCHEKHFHANNTDLGNKDNTSNQLDANLNSHKNGVSESDNGVGNVTCITCGMRFENEVKLKEHLLEYSDIGAFACEICHRKFAELYRLEAHKVKHSRLNYILSEHHCPICHEGFTSVTNVRTHVLHLHGYETFPSIVKRNLKNPTNESKNHQVSCDDDDGRKSKQPNKNNQIVHTDTSEDKMRNATGSASVPSDPKKKSSPITVIETQIKQAKCTECGLTFNNSDTLMKHKAWFINSGDHVCRQCDRRFPTLTILNSHSSKHSTDIQFCFKYRCSYCDEKFITAVSLYSHVAHVHGQNKLSDRSIQGKVFTNDDLECLENLETNIKVLHKSNVNEEQPIVTSPLNETLSNLKKKNVGNANGFHYTCPICNLIYPTLKRFQMHFKETHWDRIQETIVSPVEFDTKNTINCLVCNTACSNELDFKLHMEKVHGYHPSTETIWENQSDYTDTRKNLKTNHLNRSKIQTITGNYSVSSLKQHESLPSASAATATNQLREKYMKEEEK
ncbi:uncharacterized protein LOC143188155 isoform X2 [Calliopsis andreniformis]|uniref:uncharacterized protein LOC143188155 isoform X2 n=1 Tax=Calliopsis andreniformis TaxID=337506 RepID=UPI003FCD0F5C